MINPATTWYATAEWAAPGLGIYAGKTTLVATAETPEIAAQIAREHNAAMKVGGQAEALGREFGGVLQ